MSRNARPRAHRLLPLASVIAALFSASALGQDNGGVLSYRDDTSQVGLGVDDEGHVTGELKYLLAGTDTSGTVGELWASNGAGGLKLSHNWIPGDADGKPDRASSIRKLFGAIDQNSLHDRKLTLGGGLENEGGFLAGYISHAMSGRRQLASRQEITTSTTSGVENGRQYVDTTTLITTIDAYEHPFDWGVGVRAGRYISEHGLMVSVGADHEWGKHNSRQSTLSLDMEKHFSSSPWSVGVRLEALFGENGVSSRDRDTRGWIMLRYAFDKPVRTAPTYAVQDRDDARLGAAGGKALSERSASHTAGGIEAGALRQEVGMSPGAAPEKYTQREERRLVKTTASMTADTFFKFDSSRLTPKATETLEKISEILNRQGYVDKISLTGHTCDIGTEAYNLKLSQRRADSVKKHLVERGGIKSDDIVAVGKGETDPRYPSTKAERHKNRRVDMEFLTYLDKEESFMVQVPAEATEKTLQGPSMETAATVAQQDQIPTSAEPGLLIRSELVEREPAWIQHALFSTIPHKRTVDYYRVSRSSVSSSTERTYSNRLPLAADDSYTVASGVPLAMAVLSNDSDPDNDGLTITTIGQPMLGTATIDGDKILYTPTSAIQSGTDTFSYTVSDGHGGSATATVTVSLIANQAPVAVNDRYVIPGIGVQLFDVLANDSDPEGDPFSIVSFTQPGLGVITLEGDRLQFTSTSKFGVLTFTYTISDIYGGTSTATVMLIDP